MNENMNENDLEKGKRNLQEALLKVSKDYLDDIKLSPEEEVRYSSELEKNMAKLLKKQKKPYWKFINEPYKRAIAAGLVVVSLSCALMSFKPIRENVVEFFTNAYDRFTEFFFDDEDSSQAPKFIEEVHTLTHLPEGYVLVEEPNVTGEDYELKYVWVNQDGNEIVFYQSTLLNKTTFDTENAEARLLDNGMQVFITNKNSKIYTFWNTSDYAYNLVVTDLSEEEILNIIESFQ